MPVTNPRLWELVGRAVTDNALQRKLAENPKHVLEAHGVDTGNAEIELSQNAERNELHIRVRRGGTNFKGSAYLVITKD